MIQALEDSMKLSTVAGEAETLEMFQLPLDMLTWNVTFPATSTQFSTASWHKNPQNRTFRQVFLENS